MAYDPAMEMHKQLAALLKTRSAPAVARMSGVSVKTVYRIREGHTTNPTMSTARKLYEAALMLPAIR